MKKELLDEEGVNYTHILKLDESVLQRLASFLIPDNFTTKTKQETRHLVRNSINSSFNRNQMKGFTFWWSQISQILSLSLHLE